MTCHRFTHNPGANPANSLKYFFHKIQYIQRGSEIQIYQLTQQFKLMEKRFGILKSKLTEFKFNAEALQVECVPLVEKLFSEYIKATENLHNEKTKNNRTIQSLKTEESNKDFEYKFELLNKELIKALEENKILKEEAQKKQHDPDSDKRNKMLREKYDSKINELTNKITTLEKEIERQKKEKREMQDNLDAEMEQSHHLNEERKKLERMVLEITQQKQRVKKQLNELGNSVNEESKINELNNLLQRKISLIKELEENDLINKAKLNSLQRELDTVDKDKRRFQIENKNANGLTESLKSEINDLEKSNYNLKQENHQMHQQIQNLRKEKSSLQSLIAKYKEQEYTNTMMNETKQYSKNRIQTLYEDCQKTLDSKRKENDELRQEIQQSLQQLKRQEEKIKQLTNKNIVLNKNINQLQAQMETISSKLNQKLRENRQVEAQKLIYQRQIRELEPIRDQYNLLESKLNSKLMLEENILNKEEKGKKQLEKELKFKEEELRVFKERQEKLIIENERLNNDLKRMELFIKNGQKQLQVANSQKQNLCKQIKELKDALNSTQNSDYSNKSSTIKLQEKINSNQLLIQDLRTTLQAETNKTKSLHHQITALQIELNKSEEKNRGLHHDNTQLKQLWQSSENGKNELFMRLKQVSNDKNLTESEKIKYSEQYNNLKKQLNDSLREIERLKQITFTIDDQRDQYQRELDDKTDENARLEEQIRALHEQQNSIDRNLNMSEVSIAKLQSQLSNTQSEYQRLNRNYEKLYGEYNAVYEREQNQQKQIATQINEIKILTLSNKEMEKELERALNFSKEEARKNKDRINQYDQLRRDSQILKLNNQEYIEEIKKSRAEIDRLEHYIDEIEDENGKMYEHLKARDSKIKELNQIIVVMNESIRQNEEELVRYDRNREAMAHELDVKNEQLQRLSLELQSACQSMAWRRETIDWKAIMEEKVQKIQQETELKKRECEHFKLKVRDLENAIQAQRQENFRLTKQIKQYQPKMGPSRTLNTPSLDRFNIQYTQNIQNSRYHLNNVNYSTNKDSLLNSNREDDHNILEQSIESISSNQLHERMRRIQEQYAHTIEEAKKVTRRS